MADRDEVLAVLRAQEDATARGDAAAVLEPMTDDVVTYDLPPPLETRGNGNRDAAALDRWFATWESGVTVELADPTILVDGDLAVAFGLSRMRGVKRGEGPVDNWSRRTVVLRRGAKGWRIVHDHGSFPMLMDGSGKAATDLKPENRAK